MNKTGDSLLCITFEGGLDFKGVEFLCVLLASNQLYTYNIYEKEFCSTFD